MRHQQHRAEDLPSATGASANGATEAHTALAAPPGPYTAPTMPSVPALRLQRLHADHAPALLAFEQENRTYFYRVGPRPWRRLLQQLRCKAPGPARRAGRRTPPLPRATGHPWRGPGTGQPGRRGRRVRRAWLSDRGASRRARTRHSCRTSCLRPGCHRVQIDDAEGSDDTRQRRLTRRACSHGIPCCL